MPETELRELFASLTCSSRRASGRRERGQLQRWRDFESQRRNDEQWTLVRTFQRIPIQILYSAAVSATKFLAGGIPCAQPTALE